MSILSVVSNCQHLSNSTKWLLGGGVLFGCSALTVTTVAIIASKVFGNGTGWLYHHTEMTVPVSPPISSTDVVDQSTANESALPPSSGGASLDDVAPPSQSGTMHPSHPHSPVDEEADRRLAISLQAAEYAGRTMGDTTVRDCTDRLAHSIAHIPDRSLLHAHRQEHVATRPLGSATTEATHRDATRERPLPDTTHSSTRLEEHQSGDRGTHNGLVAEMIVNRPINPKRLDLSSRSEEVTDEALAVALEGCASLTTLNLSHCRKVTDEGLKVIATHCPNLKVLNLSNCANISSVGIQAIVRACPNLEQLVLRWDDGARPSPITDEVLQEMAGCRLKLRLLNIGGCKEVSNTSLAALLPVCPDLQQLYLNRCNKITDATLDAIGSHCKKLTTLHLARCVRVTNTGIEILLSSCSELTDLDLSECLRLSSEGCLAISLHGKKLQGLNLHSCVQINDTGVAAIRMSCKNLTHWDLSDCTKISGETLKPIGDDVPNLSYLNVGGCPLNNKGIEAIKAYGPRLRQLILAGVSLTDSGLTDLAKSCPNLVLLNLSGNPVITQAGLHALGVHCTELSQLGLAECKQIGDAELETIGEHFGQLKQVTFNGCKKITDDGVEALTRGCTQLHYLALFHCEHISDRSLQAISRLPDLTELDLRLCPNITYGGIDHVQNACPKLKESKLRYSLLDRSLAQSLRFIQQSRSYKT